MKATSAMQSTGREHFLIGLARAFGGAIFFSLPLLMTMEMWQLGFSMGRGRLLLLMALTLPMLERLSHYSGFEETHSVLEDVKDAIVAFGIGIVASLGILLLFRVIDAGTGLDEAIGKVTLQAIPASIGAILANSQLSGVDAKRRRKVVEERQDEAGYAGQIFLMMAGAVFFAFNVAPTEEMVLIAYRMTAWHALALATVSIALMHAFVFAVNFRGQHDIPEDTPWWSVFVRYSAMGYALSLAVSAYILWTFGRFDDRAFEPFVTLTVVLGFPAGLGAAAARLFL
jgi:putative integral membrane protein (TIGR02587 family)